jgi:hypothetical protein
MAHRLGYVTAAFAEAPSIARGHPRCGTLAPHGGALSLRGASQMERSTVALRLALGDLTRPDHDRLRGPEPRENRRDRRMRPKLA